MEKNDTKIVGLPEEPFSRGAVEMEAYLSMFSGSVDMAFADYVRKLRAYSSAAEQRVGELLEELRVSKEGAEGLSRIADFQRKRAEEFREIGQGFERDYRNTFEQSCKNLQRAEQLQRDLDAARACINSVPEPIFSPDDSYQWRNWLSKHAAAIALAKDE